jgi:hypothetical protein
MPTKLFQFSGSPKNGGSGWKSIADGAIVEKVTIDYPIESGRYVEHEVEFAAADGALTCDATWAEDSAIPNPMSVAGMYATWGGATIANITFMRLVLIGNNADFIDSSSTGITRRKPGNIDARAIIRTNIPNAAALQAANAIEELYVGKRDNPAVTPWKMKWMKCMGWTPVVDIQGKNGKPEIVAADVHFAFTGYKDGTVGSIISSAGATIWPEP